MNLKISIVGLCVGLATCGCGESGQAMQAMGGQLGSECSHDAECDNGVYCDGTEYCADGYCKSTATPSCDDGIACTTDRCDHQRNGCVFEPPDEDGDGHYDASCEDVFGNSMGDDCDDSDSARFPGNLEICSPSEPTHDEDCDAQTFGSLDADEDGAVSGVCCNEGADGEVFCGNDCDDEEFRRNPSYPEICDDIDNDCDGKVDVNTKEVLWYPDADQDNYGDPGAEGILSCAPIEGAALTALDCNDGAPAIHLSAAEACDGLDNNCDGNVDEDGVCSCPVEGAAQACACDADTLTPRVGIQLCENGIWGACDCTECVDGVVECSAGIIPRRCENGRWTIKNACSGLFPVCMAGQCVCADGTMNCQDVVDITPPIVVASVPAAGEPRLNNPNIFTVTFNEPLASSSVNQSTVTLRTAMGDVLPGTVYYSGSSLSFQPAQPLLPGVHYSLRMEGVTDLADNEVEPAVDLPFIVATGRLMGETIEEVDSYLSIVDVAASPSAGPVAIGPSYSTTDGNLLQHSIYEWTGSKFELQQVMDTNHEPRGIAVDGRGWIAALTGWSTTSLVERQGSTWSETSVASGGSLVPVVRCNDAGDCVLLNNDGTTLTVKRRDSLGEWTTALSTAVSYSSSQPLLVQNANGDFAAQYYDGNGQVLRGGASGPLFAPLTIGELSAGHAVAIDESGRTATAWLSTYVVSPQVQSQYMFTTGLIAANGSWSQFKTILHPQDYAIGHQAPRLLSLGADNWLACWSEYRYVNGQAFYRLHAANYAPGSGWSAKSPVDLSGRGEAAQRSMWLGTDGRAHVVWRQIGSNGNYDIWHNSWSADTGWDEPAELEDIAATVDGLHVVQGPGQQTWVLYGVGQRWSWFLL